MTRILIEPSRPLNKGVDQRPRAPTSPGIWYAPLAYGFGRLFFKTAFFFCVRAKVLHRERSECAGGYILAVTHLSHLEPVCAGVVIRRRIDWVARIEFYRWKPAAWGLRAVDAFSINRQGVPVKAIRTAIERARSGRIVGLFPEGGVAVGADSVCRGGPLKQGAAMIACRAQVPIIPCVMVGTTELNRVSAWLPFRRSQLYMIFGEPISPAPFQPGRTAAGQRRQDRAAMTAQLQTAFGELFRELCQRCGIEDGQVP